MKETGEQPAKTSTKKSVFDLFTEIIGWLQIFAAPFLIGLIIGALIYFPKPNASRSVIALLIIILGLVIGMIWATRAWKKKGTIHFMSKLTANPELDRPGEA